LDDAYATNLYFPADPLQMKAVVEKIFFDPGLRFGRDVLRPCR